MKILVVDDDPQVGRLVARLLRSAEVNVDVFDDAEEALAAARSEDYDLVISDIVMPKMGGLELLRAVRSFDLDLPVILLTGTPTIDSAKRAVEYGAYRYLTKPPDPDELAQAVERAVFSRKMSKIRRQVAKLQGGASDHPSDMASLQLAFDIALERMWIAYQPIVRASDGSVYGYEALMRSHIDALPHPGAILSAAEQLGRLPDVARTVRALAPLPFVDAADDAVLFINLHPSDLADPELLETGTALANMASRVVMEVTERASLNEVPRVSETIAYLRSQRYRIAVDDLGSGYAGLSSFAALEPEVVKLDMALIRDVDTNETKQRLVSSVVELCSNLEVLVVAEGIETAGERDACVKLGVELLQGYFIAKPGKPFPAVHW